MALLNQSADLLTNQGINSMQASARAGRDSFLVMQGGSSRYQTGSGFDLDSFSLLGGVVWGPELNDTTAAGLGLFLETGWGDYNSSNSFSNMPSVEGSGDTRYVGFGALGSVNWDSGFYTDASFRLGWVKNDLSTDVIKYGQNGSYGATSSLYFGAHLGLGWHWRLTRQDTIDFYTRYAWTHADSDEVIVLGDSYQFDNSDSQRWRNGVKYARAMGEFAPYLGLAHEFEFDGQADGQVYGYRLRETDMGGSSLIGELGLSWTPADYITLALALEGSLGQREGVSGIFQIKFGF
jgi:hypothetical protein